MAASKERLYCQEVWWSPGFWVGGGMAEVQPSPKKTISWSMNEPHFLGEKNSRPHYLSWSWDLRLDASSSFNRHSKARHFDSAVVVYIAVHVAIRWGNNALALGSHHSVQALTLHVRSEDPLIWHHCQWIHNFIWAFKVDMSFHFRYRKKMVTLNWSFGWQRGN